MMTDGTEIQRLVIKPVSAPNLLKAVEAGDKEIYALTGRNDWVVGDYVFGKLQNIGALYGAFTILQSWDKDEYLEKAKLMLQAYTNAVAEFKDLPLPESDTNPHNFMDDLATSEYDNPYLNPDKPFFLSQY